MPGGGAIGSLAAPTGVTSSLPSQQQKRLRTQVDLIGPNAKSHEGPLSARNINATGSPTGLYKQVSEEDEDKKFFFEKNDPVKEKLLSGSKSP